MYQALYRKWRPRFFSDVVGQDAITTTIKNQAKHGRLSHAYLFYGPRGSGKTSCARILAKALNCTDLKDGEPCGVCAACLEIDGGSLDIVEIDAASNNGVSNIRDLRDETVYTPIHLKKKVYIIDEVHMLSTAAFNALLKTLEEPPSHVAFVLATTETHKVPATILSRCQRFDFKRIMPEDVYARLRFVAEQENIQLEDDAFLLLAQLADGALRNGLSLLEQVSGRQDEALSVQEVRRLLGLSGSQALLSLLACLPTGDTAAAFCLIEQLYAQGVEVSALANELFDAFVDLLCVKTNGDKVQLIGSAYTGADLLLIAQQFSYETLLFAISCIKEAQNSIARTGTPKGELQLLIYKICNPVALQDLSAINARLSALEQKIAAAPSSIPAATAAVPTAPLNTAPVPPAQLAAKKASSVKVPVPQEEDVPPFAVADTQPKERAIPPALQQATEQEGIAISFDTIEEVQAQADAAVEQGVAQKGDSWEIGRAHV